jgi:UDP-N-acetylmuramyl pentapeptide phosphotransferase/UDP-N-acetylglucosamine-1-phosphate transferase
MFAFVLGFVTAFILTYTLIPVIIRVAKDLKLYDRPNERSAHIEPTPSLGGVAIFAGAVCGTILWTPYTSFGVLQYILAAFVLIFLLGITDDLISVSPTKKFAGQLLVAIILTYKANIRITNFYGVFGIYDLPDLTSYILSIVVIVGIINAFNLIDGIDGLAGSIGLLACLVWGTWFVAANDPALAILAFSLSGALIAFLKFNFTPARIFMGDTGSLLLGTVCSILSIRFIEMNHQIQSSSGLSLSAAPAIAVSILILPLYDTLRVFVRRIAQGRSPFHPDKNHIHHLLLDAGFNHLQSTALLIGVNILFILTAVMLNYLGTVTLLIIETAMALLFTLVLVRMSKNGDKTV